MRKTVHLCLSSHDEIMYRNEADLIMGFNCLALAVLKTESRLMAEGFLSTHNHSLLQTDNYKEVMRSSRYSYARYFNAKYSRRGRLGEKQYFVLEVEGLYHCTSASNYVLRQGLHHGLSDTPFGYPHCSANAIFQKELGKETSVLSIPKEKRYLYLPEGVAISEEYRMNEKGLLLREDIVDTAYMEEIYISPRNFLYQMNRLSGQKEIQEQQNENNTPPVTIDKIEAGVPEFDVKKALINEQGKVNRSILSDIQLCDIIDNKLVKRYFKDSHESSIYLLSERQRANIGNLLWADKNIYGGKFTSTKQIKRCLAL